MTRDLIVKLKIKDMFYSHSHFGFDGFVALSNDLEIGCGDTIDVWGQFVGTLVHLVDLVISPCDGFTVLGHLVAIELLDEVHVHSLVEETIFVGGGRFESLSPDHLVLIGLWGHNLGLILWGTSGNFSSISEEERLDDLNLFRGGHRIF